MVIPASVLKIFVELVFFGSLACLILGFKLIAGAVGNQAMEQAFLVGSLVCGWYSVSITLILYNKWLVSQWRDGGLNFPIFYTMTHMMLKGCFAFLYLMCVRRKSLPKSRAKIIGGCAVIGITTALDVAASNMSFLFIGVTFFTMLKSSSLIWLVVMGAITGVEPCSRGITGIVMVITLGAFLSSYGEVDFNWYGFCLVIFSEWCAAVRWIVTQMVLHGGKLDSMTAVFYMSPSSTMTLIPLVLSWEQDEIDVFETPQKAYSYWVMILFPGFLAFLLLLVEVQLVKETSSLTLSIFGNLKSIVTIALAILVFGEDAAPLQWVGLAVALCGLFGYSRLKKQKVGVDSLAQLGYEALTDSDSDADLEVLPVGSARAVVIGARREDAYDPESTKTVSPSTALAKDGTGVASPRACRANGGEISRALPPASSERPLAGDMEVASEAAFELQQPPAMAAVGDANGCPGTLHVASPSSAAAAHGLGASPGSGCQATVGLQEQVEGEQVEDTVSEEGAPPIQQAASRDEV